MNVIQLSGGVIPVPPGDEPDGIEDYIYRIAHALSSLGCNVTVIDIKAGEFQKKKRRESSATFHELWHLPLSHRYTNRFLQRIISFTLILIHTWLYTLLSSLSLFKLLSKQKIDIINAHICEPAIGAVLINKLKGNHARIVYATHTPIVMSNKPWRKYFLNFNETLALKLADHVVADTPAVKTQLIKSYNIPAEKITAIIAHGGFSEEEVIQYLSSKLEMKRDEMTVLCVSKITTSKNQMALIKAIKKVLTEEPQTKFIFAGAVLDINYFQTIKQFVLESGLTSSVEIKGEVTRKELSYLYSQATLFVFPSTFESQGTVVIEALTFGLPVIASMIEPVTDVAKCSPGTIIQVDMANTERLASEIVRLLRDKNERNRISYMSKELARRFSWENMAIQTVELYKTLLKTEKQRPGL